MDVLRVNEIIKDLDNIVREGMSQDGLAQKALHKEEGSHPGSGYVWVQNCEEDETANLRRLCKKRYKGRVVFKVVQKSFDAFGDLSREMVSLWVNFS